MKLYTKKGDAGFTSLLDGRRVRKDDSRILACGMIDELNCHVGLALAEANRSGHDLIGDLLGPIQNDLFALGMRVAALGTDKSPRRLSGEDVEALECRIDAICEGLEPLGHFILPGGCELAARLHVCRAVCRRAETAVIHLLNPMDEHFVHDPLAVQYLNRLSDLLFAAARMANRDARQAEVTWPPPAG